MNKPETEVQVADLLRQLTSACTESAKQLNDAMKPDKWDDDIPYVYTMPKMSLSMKVALSYSEGKVKGVLWWKSRSGTQVDSLSQIDVEIVAVPRHE